MHNHDVSASPRGGYSKTQLRKGELKTCGSSAIPRHAMRGKNGTTGDEEAALFDVSDGEKPALGHNEKD